MFPLNPTFLWFLKFFVVLTCIAFWVDVFMSARRRKARFERHRSRTQQRAGGEGDE